jgi:hypothetical protein
MFEHARRRRDANELVEPEPQRTAPPAPSAASILALQATAGNRAVQRLMYSQSNSRLTMPATFASQKARWNDALGYVDETSEEKSLFDLRANFKVKEALQTSLGVDYLQELRSVADATLAEEAKGLAADANDEKLVKALSESAVNHTRLIFEDDQPFDQKSLLKAFTFIPAFKDLLPEKPDLPAAGQSLREGIPGTEDREGNLTQYWTLVCVLIALCKNETDTAKATKIMGRAPAADGLGAVVQALHNHYVGKPEPVQYDDTSSRMTLMKDWGYRLIFSGDVPWSVIHRHVKLLKNKKYIVDTEDHAVKVTVENDLPASKEPLTAVGDYLMCHSERDNYSFDEAGKNVRYVWLGS